MLQVEEDIKKAQKLLCTHKIFNNKANRFSKIYPYSNENIKEMFANFDLMNKTCFSVLASSDQVLDMYSRGAKKVIPLMLIL